MITSFGMLSCCSADTNQPPLIQSVTFSWTEEKDLLSTFTLSNPSSHIYCVEGAKRNRQGRATARFGELEFRPIGGEIPRFGGDPADAFGLDISKSIEPEFTIAPFSETTGTALLIGDVIYLESNDKSIEARVAVSIGKCDALSENTPIVSDWFVLFLPE